MSAAAPSYDIDVAGAAAALTAAGGVDKLMQDETRGITGEPAPAASTPVAPAESPASPSATPASPAQQPGAAEDTGWSLNISELPPEVQPLAKSLLGDYTQKTQTLAEQRKQYEQLGDIDTVRAALELHETLQDPRAWPALHAELTQELTRMGYTPAQANAAASEALTGAVEQPQAAGLPDLSALSDPEFEPLKVHLESVRSEVNALKAELASAREHERVEQLRLAALGEITRQENIIRAANPAYTDDDIQAIIERAPAHGGSLLDAQRAFAADETRMLERYLAAKSSPGATTAAPVSGGAVTTETPTEIKDFDQAHAGVMERLRQIGALSS